MILWTWVGELKNAMGISDELGGETTGDLLLVIHESLEKHKDAICSHGKVK